MLRGRRSPSYVATSTKEASFQPLDYSLPQSGSLDNCWSKSKATPSLLVTKDLLLSVFSS